MLCWLTLVQQVVAPHSGKKLVSTVCSESVIPTARQWLYHFLGTKNVLGHAVCHMEVNEALLRSSACMYCLHYIIYLLVPYNAVGCMAAYSTAIGSSRAPAVFTVDYTKDDISVHL